MPFAAEAEAILHAGVETAPLVSVDDTGARPADRNGVTTLIGNDAFTWFGTNYLKCRFNFMQVPGAGHGDVPAEVEIGR